MATSNNALTVTGLSFDEIRGNLRNFLAAKPTFKDVDFTDSAIGELLDLLAYNSYYLAYYTNMSISEAFIDTAQLYDSVVSRAKALGYRPISAQGASANLHIAFSAQANTTVRALTIAKHTAFTTSLDGTTYTFVTPESYSVQANSTNGFARHFTIVEGIPLTHSWVFTAANTTLTIPNTNTDLRGVSVVVTTAGNTATYLEATDIFAVNHSSLVFFLDADTNHRYRLSFGDGILGKVPEVGSLVTVTYRTCDAAKSNGAKTFTAVSQVAGQSAFTLTTAERAGGGTDQEPIESIRFNAPRAYETQHRGVTLEDYKRIILQLNPDLIGVSAWGGEDNVPPIYGKIFVAVNPATGRTIGLARKADLVGQLRRYNTQTIIPVFVDPTLLYLMPRVIIHYNPDKTSLTASDLATAAGAKIANYEASILNRFDGRFKTSRFLDEIDSADRAITGSSLSLNIQKRFVPRADGVATTYQINFNTTLNASVPLTSTAFTYLAPLNGTLRSFLDDDGAGRVRIYTIGTNGEKSIITAQAGTIDYERGIVVLTALAMTAFEGDELTLTTTPDQSHVNIIPIRNQILLIRSATISVINEKSLQLEISNQSVTTIGSADSLLAPSYSTTVSF